MIEKLIKIQVELKAPKNQRNKFGNYNYRSCEDIVEAVKPLLAREGLLMTISDEIVVRGAHEPTIYGDDGEGVTGDQRFYVNATVTITDGEKTCYVSAFAREAETKKGMDAAQITGAASSYARKYALNGMFAIDDTKDADSTNTHGKKEEDEAPNTEADDLPSFTL